MDSKLVVAFVALLTVSTLPLRTDAQTALNINRTGCGTSKFCASEPAACDPSTGGSCFFASSVSISGQTLAFQLAGQSTGYIALGVSFDANQGSNDTIYVCANNMTNVVFSSNLLDNNNLTSNPVSSANFIQGSVNGSSIQCTFSATVPNATTVNASSATTFYLFIFNGTFRNGSLGSPNAVFRSSSAVDVSVNNSTTNNSLTATSANPSETALNINRTGCGTSKFCASQPAACDPSMGGSCFFASSVSISGQNLAFQLAGQSTGYIALGLSVDEIQGGNDTTYVCANNNSKILFSSNLLNNNSFTSNSASTASLTQSSVNGSYIQCTFTATVPNATTVRASAATTFYLFISNGTFMNGNLGSPNAVFRSSSAVDVSNPNSTTTNALSTPNGGEGPFHHFLSQALLTALGILGLAMLC